MYVSPSVYRQLIGVHRQAKSRSQVRLIRGIYTGCMSSALIRREKIEKVYTEIENYYNSERRIIPIDNFIRSLMSRKKLEVGITLPFLSSIDAQYIKKSTIQNTEKMMQ